MNLVKRDFEDFFDFFTSDRPFEMIDRAFGSLRTQLPTVTIPFQNTVAVDGGVEVRIAAPGLSKEDFDVRVKDNQLRVSAKVVRDEESVEDSFHSREYSYESFTRVVALPKTAQAEGISAKYEAGELKVFVPTEEDKPEVVEISVD